MNLLRHFIHTKYVSLLDLKHIGRMRAGIRPEVRKEVEEFLSKKG
jgi:hypothetical protein